MRRVISASRRVDMVSCFPDELIRLLEEKCPPDHTHTLVLWTKNPTNLLEYAPLREASRKYPLYIHFTITGMGGMMLEPGVPSWEEMVAILDPLTEYAGNPRRIRIRFDPIVHLRLPEGDDFCNLEKFEPIAAAAEKRGITDFSISWMAIYRKVVSRLQKYGISPLSVTSEKWQEEFDWLTQKASEHSVRLHGCCVAGMPVSRCIDGELLTELHPAKLPCSTERAKGQRKTCGCTESLDIGWYNPCPHGCIYCYANPAATLARNHGH